MYNEKMQFVQTVIHNIYRTRTSTFEFLRKSKRSWCTREEIGPGVTLVDLMVVEELEEDEVVE
jgi:hypothetical protein